jgi:hypothetical protein
MTAPPVWKRGFVSLGAVLMVVMVAGAAHAEDRFGSFRSATFTGGAFRKKAPAPPAETAEPAPSGGDSATEAAPAGEAAGSAATQAEDKDFPEAQAQRDKARADAALQRQMKNAELAKQRDQGEPFYQKWQFWAIAGAVVVGGALAIWGGTAVWHSMQGGDVRACNTSMFGTNCFGEGR